jgi:hypothetical protein
MQPLYSAAVGCGEETPYSREELNPEVGSVFFDPGVRVPCDRGGGVFLWKKVKFFAAKNHRLIFISVPACHGRRGQQQGRKTVEGGGR